MLGVDRLDMIKGIPQKLLAFEEFLEEHPEWRDKVLLVQIAVPSRTDVPEYQVARDSPCHPSALVHTFVCDALSFIISLHVAWAHLQLINHACHCKRVPIAAYRVCCLPASECVIACCG